METRVGENEWAVILGASSGFGEAAAISLARAGFHIIGIHLDRRAAKERISAIISKIESAGRRAHFININAAAHAKREEALDTIAAQLKASDEGSRSGVKGRVRVLLHSLAFGTLKPLIADNPLDRIDPAALEMTIDVMGNSLVYWTQGLISRELMTSGGRIFAMTSAGSLQMWKSYGAVSAAKCTLESHCRQLAVELAPLGITANAIMAGVTDTPALRKIPGHDKMIETATARNPSGRLTLAMDVAKLIVLLASPDSAWMTGNTIRVDGGESIAG